MAGPSRLEREVAAIEKEIAATLRAEIAYRLWLMMSDRYHCLDAVKEFRRAVETWAEAQEPHGE